MLKSDYAEMCSKGGSSEYEGVKSFHLIKVLALAQYTTRGSTNPIGGNSDGQHWCAGPGDCEKKWRIKRRLINYVSSAHSKRLMKSSRWVLWGGVKLWWSLVTHIHTHTQSNSGFHSEQIEVRCFSSDKVTYQRKCNSSFFYCEVLFFALELE